MLAAIAASTPAAAATALLSSSGLLVAAAIASTPSNSTTFPASLSTSTSSFSPSPSSSSPPPPPPPSRQQIAYISLAAVAAAAALIVADAVISLLLGLGLHFQLLVGAARCVAQLSVLGLVLGPIFTKKSWPLVAGYACFMLLVGSSEAASRPAYGYRGMRLHVVSCLGAAATCFLSYSLVVAIRPTPSWWDPQYSIPTLGLMLGNAVSGVAVGLGALLDDFANNADRIELLLCLGASRWEASRGAIARAVRLALTPLLNQLNVVGLVWIPGMMTGQMIAGADPSQAARYQMVVMFLVSATTASAATGAVVLASSTLLDGNGRLRRDLLVKKSKGDKKGGLLLPFSNRLGEFFVRRRGRRRDGGGGREPLLADARS